MALYITAQLPQVLLARIVTHKACGQFRRRIIDRDVSGARDSNAITCPSHSPIPLQKRNFLLSGKAEVSILRCTLAILFLHEGSRPRPVGYQHPRALVAATGLLDTAFAEIRLLKTSLKS